MFYVKKGLQKIQNCHITLKSGSLAAEAGFEVIGFLLCPSCKQSLSVAAVNLFYDKMLK
jgi:hypothetical protein